LVGVAVDDAEDDVEDNVEDDVEDDVDDVESSGFGPRSGDSPRKSAIAISTWRCSSQALRAPL